MPVRFNGLKSCSRVFLCRHENDYCRLTNIRVELVFTFLSQIFDATTAVFPERACCEIYTFLLFLVGGGLQVVQAGNDGTDPKGAIAVSGISAHLFERMPVERPVTTPVPKHKRLQSPLPALPTVATMPERYKPHAASTTALPTKPKLLATHRLSSTGDSPGVRPSTHGGGTLGRLKIDTASQVTTPTSAMSVSISPASSSPGFMSSASSSSGSLASGGSAKTSVGFHRRLKKQSAPLGGSVTPQPQRISGGKKGRMRLSGSLPALPAAVLDVAAEKGGLVVSVAPLAAGGAIAISLGGSDSVFLPDVPAETDEVYFVYDFSAMTFEDFKALWVGVRHALYGLRKRLMDFREHYTLMVRRGQIDRFIEECSEYVRIADRHLGARRCSSAFKSLEDIDQVYKYACEKYEAALIHAEKLGVGNYIDFHFSLQRFDRAHELPANGVGLGMLNRPLCFCCSRHTGSRVVYSGFTEAGLEFDDECSRCDKSFLQQMYQYEMIYDPAGREMIHAPGFMEKTFVFIDDAYKGADYFLKCIFLGERRSL